MKSNNKYLIGVSGGPDSMALLDMYKDKCYVEVAHVNYHKRDSAKRDEKIVRAYCKKHNIKFHKVDYDSEDNKGNFQAKARQFRYDYFKKLCNKNELDGVLIAHHKDDLIETYLMQVDKKLGVDYYGLKPKTNLYGVEVYRPLLKYTKKQLLDYCKKHNIVYGIDESNLSDHYTRNVYRHNKVDNLDNKKKNEIVRQIKEANLKKASQVKLAKKQIHKNGKYSIDEFVNNIHVKQMLRLYLPNASEKYIEETIRQLKQSKSCIIKYKDLYIVKEYGEINIFNKPNEYSYCFKNINELKNNKYEYFKIVSKGDNKHGVTLDAKDFPIIIRNVQDNDEIKMLYGTKKLNRFFIDNKVRLLDRLTWPIVINSSDSAILVPEIGCNFNHYSENHNLYVVKL